jgi:predicted nucleic acid-binding protein
MSAEEGLAFVDTNILVYAFERSRSERGEIARRLVGELIEQDRIRLSTQVLQELYVTLTRKAREPSSAEEAITCLDSLTAWPVFVVDYPAVRDAVLLSRDAVIHFWDALLVVAANRAGAKRLYTEDLNHGQRILGVEIANPFRPLDDKNL